MPSRDNKSVVWSNRIIQTKMASEHKWKFLQAIGNSIKWEESM